MNILRREMKANQKSLFFWCCGIILLIVSGMVKYDGLATSGQSVNDIMQAMPKTLQVIFGTYSLDLTSAIGYFGVLYSYLVLMASIHAVMLGVNVISKEEIGKTAEFLITKPQSRTRIISMKLTAVFLQLLIFLTTSWLTSTLIIGKYENHVGSQIAILMVGIFFIQLIFVTIGSSIAAVSNQPKQSASIATAILLMLYILSIVVNLSSQLEKLMYLTPFKYFDGYTLLFGDGLRPAMIVLSVVITLFCLVVTYKAYLVKDLHI